MATTLTRCFTTQIPKFLTSKITLLFILCTAFYIIGLWQHARPNLAAITSSASNYFIQTPCTSTNSTPQLNKPGILEFSPRHGAEDRLHTSTHVPQIPPCNPKYTEYIPCEDTKRSLKYDRDRLIYRERHCPEKHELMKCRIPAPYGYKVPFRWPESRDMVWYVNAPHKELAVEKKNQHWIVYEGETFKFPGGGTMFPDGAAAYIDDIGRLINLYDGSIRTALDTGCGVASWGAYLLSRNILTMSFAPRDTHEGQVQFALERGVPALLGIMASNRLPYPSRSFDMAHCSRCLIPWGQYDGQYLIEVDRVLHPGGYWILSGPPINWQKRWKGWNRTEGDLKSEQTLIETVARNLCWRKVVERGDLAIWQKPTNHIHCKIKKRIFKSPPFCKAPEPDMAWYTKMETCLIRLPEVSGLREVSGGQLEKWPKRLTAIPPRIQSGSLKGITADVFTDNNELWINRVAYYKTISYQLAETGMYRNLLDMNAYLGGFAAALIDDPVWVMNVVPVEAEINTLGVVYERGLIGTYQNWCEAMSTYPRTYDLIHADSVFTLYKDRCEMEDILLEMDRILRPEGTVIIRDDVDLLTKIKSFTDTMQWDSKIADHESKGPHEREKILVAVKQYWTAPDPKEN